MSKNVFDVILLFALPASGKSEVRRYLSFLEPKRQEEEFHFGGSLQLDDFPYVFLMRLIDDTLVSMGHKRVYYPGEEPFIDGRDWGTLANLLNEDYYDMINKNVVTADSMAEYYFQRLESAALKAGIYPRLAHLDKEVRKTLAEKLEAHCRKMQEEKIAGYPDSMENKTIVIEMARGGAIGATLPLNDPFGYQYTLRQFCPEILEKAAILYIEVTPEESRRKNRERYNPEDPGSIISHFTPEIVMERDYGCDDLRYLISISDIPDTVRVETQGQVYHIPAGVFSNMPDKTTFLRAEPENWDAEMVKQISSLVRSATDTMWKNYPKD